MKRLFLFAQLLYFRAQGLVLSAQVIQDFHQFRAPQTAHFFVRHTTPLLCGLHSFPLNDIVPHPPAPRQDRIRNFAQMHKKKKKIVVHLAQIPSGCDVEIPRFCRRKRTDRTAKDLAGNDTPGRCQTAAAAGEGSVRS